MSTSRSELEYHQSRIEDSIHRNRFWLVKRRIALGMIFVGCIIIFLSFLMS